MKMAQKSPIVHERKVSAGISMSSVLETAARTSGYGDSSSHSVGWTGRGRGGTYDVGVGEVRGPCVHKIRYAPAVVSELESMLGSKNMPFWNWKAAIASFEREWEMDVGRLSAAKLTA
jgi:hypothetical protein